MRKKSYPEIAVLLHIIYVSDQEDRDSIGLDKKKK